MLDFSARARRDVAISTPLAQVRHRLECTQAHRGAAIDLVYACAHHRVQRAGCRATARWIQARAIVRDRQDLRVDGHREKIGRARRVHATRAPFRSAFHRETLVEAVPQGGHLRNERCLRREAHQRDLPARLRRDHAAREGTLLSVHDGDRW